MKKSIIIILFLLIVSQMFFITAQDDTVSEKAYACLEDNVEGRCSSLSTEEKIFSLLTIDRCKTELMSDSSNDECWPNSGCRIKTTAQTVLALNSLGLDTVEIENWLLDQKLTPSDVDWLLQVDSTVAGSMTCTISYADKSYDNIIIDEDKTISKSAGTCLNLYTGDYWFEISSNCYNEEFTISCDKTFSTSLLYKKKNSDVIYVPNELKSGSAEGFTTEKINSFCLGTSGCDYEGTLWAALVLNLRGYDVSTYLPYLITMADDNSEYLPESFLYSLTNDFRNELLEKQKENQYWSASGDKFYDTSVALYSLQSENPNEKTNAMEWLGEVQGKDGCWQGNIRNTAFILASVWPTKSFFVEDSQGDCGDNGYYCATEAKCTDSGGDVLVDYSGCFAPEQCCTVQPLLESCSAQGGEICTGNEDCIGGIEVEAAGTSRCCVQGGECGISSGPSLSECEENGGVCRTSCSDDETVESYDCPSFKECCFEKQKKGLPAIVWILGILIVLTIIGIIFREKLRDFWFKIKSKFRRGGGKSSSVPTGGYSPGRFPPPSSSIPPRGIPRKILPPRTQRRKAPAQKTRKEIDDVLKKLKDIGK